MITTTAWVRQGVAAQFPTKYEIDEDDMNRISKLARMQLEDAQKDLNAAKSSTINEGGDDIIMEEDGKEANAMSNDGEQKASKQGTSSETNKCVYRSIEMRHN